MFMYTLRQGAELEEARDIARAFEQPDFTLRDDVLSAARFVRDADIGNHDFFRHANENKIAMRCWVAQELTITNAFSQRLCETAGLFANVYIRQHLLELVMDEHEFQDDAGIVHPAHPVLLQRVAGIVDLQMNAVRRLEPTKRYLRILENLCSHGPLQALGAIGVGNELLLVSEYTAARESYISSFSRKDGADFFDANISADTHHYEVCAAAASAFCTLYDLPP